MPLQFTHATHEAAAADLTAHGFAFRPTLGGYYTKLSKVDDACGGYERPAIVTIAHRRVDPAYNAPDYFELCFS